MCRTGLDIWIHPSKNDKTGEPLEEDTERINSDCKHVCFE